MKIKRIREIGRENDSHEKETKATAIGWEYQTNAHIGINSMVCFDTFSATPFCAIDVRRMCCVFFFLLCFTPNY